MKKIIFILSLFMIASAFSQELTGSQLVEKSIQYHDPNGNWKTFNDTLFVTMKSPERPVRKSKITINLPKEYFNVTAMINKNITQYTINKDECEILYNGKTPTETEKEQNKLSCKRAKLYKNYYTYLYGLPMKLKDEGTHIHKKVTRKKFKDKEYLVVKVMYSEAVGSDTWYFYFNPTTYALEVYQFFKASPTSGEYILLSDEEIINGIKMPKVRAWYYNKNDAYLATDYLSKS